MVKEDEIRLIAYHIWEQGGCINGKDYEHWFKAKAIWKERQKPFRENATKESESLIPSVMITPPPKDAKLLSQPAKKNIRGRQKKK